MLDQRKMFCEENNHIVDLVNFEKNIKQIEAERPVKVRLAKDGNSLQVTYDGVILNGVVDRPIKHQLGGRAWGGNNGYEHINHMWRKKFSDNPEDLEHELVAVFRNNDLFIRYSTDSKGQNNIYGVVSPHFIDVNQLDFRHHFLEKIRKDTALNPDSLGITTSKYGEVTEFFDFNHPGFQTKFRYGLVYAKNNGYDAYKVNWEREVLICTNGLTGWQSSESRWKHTKEIDLDAFISSTVNEGIANQEFLERRIKISQEKALRQSVMNELMERLSLAKASKNRIKNRLHIESCSVGNNEWALSQALTWLGTHERSFPFSVKPKLTDLGTKILENSLVNTLDANAQVDRSGMYRLLLPKDIKESAIA